MRKINLTKQDQFELNVSMAHKIKTLEEMIMILTDKMIEVTEKIKKIENNKLSPAQQFMFEFCTAPEKLDG